MCLAQGPQGSDAGEARNQGSLLTGDIEGNNTEDPGWINMIEKML